MQHTHRHVTSGLSGSGARDVRDSPTTQLELADSLRGNPPMLWANRLGYSCTRSLHRSAYVYRSFRSRGRGLVSGAITPYPSPDCECELLTTFRGEIRGIRIDGTYTTRHLDCEMPLERGTWWAERRRGS